MKTKIFIITNLVILIFLLESGCKQNAEKIENQTVETQKEIYTCPMHPSVVSNKPGACPVCGMELVKKSNIKEKYTGDLDKIRSISLSPTQRIIANVETYYVTKKELTYKINTFGVVDFAEPNFYVISSRYKGRIEKLYVSSVGYFIKKGEILFEIYSPELIAAQNEFLLAINNYQEELRQAIRQKLILHYGLTENQILELESKKKILDKIPVHSPFSGIVSEKEIQEGQYIEEGMMLYRINDISKVWIIFELYEKDLPFINLGSKVEVKLEQNPKTQINGIITFIEPKIESESRTVRVRSEFENPDGVLKPNMFVTGNILIHKNNVILIPRSAVLYTGKKERVWIETTENTFEPREVVTGIKTENEIEIVHGIDVGDKVVVSGGYLIDSESIFQYPNSFQDHKEENDNLFSSEITILVDGKYTPEIIRAKKGQKLRINFERHDNIKCTDEVIFPDFNIKKYLPPHQTTTIEIHIEKSGEYVFYCGMEMIKGKIIVRD